MQPIHGRIELWDRRVRRAGEGVCVEGEPCLGFLDGRNPVGSLLHMGEATWDRPVGRSTVTQRGAYLLPGDPHA